MTKKYLAAQYGINNQPKPEPQTLTEDFNPAQYGFRRRRAVNTVRPLEAETANQTPLPLLEALQKQQNQIDRLGLIISRLTSQVNQLSQERNRTNRSINDLYSEIEKKVDVRSR